MQTIEQLYQAIAEAEERHIAAGLVVELRREDLNDALHAQNNTRQAVMDLRYMLIAREKEAANANS